MSHEKSVMPHVCILLATLNGMKYLKQQLASINGQIGVRISILANDDGSSDGTLNYLESLKLSGEILTVSKSNQIGSTRAFLNLLDSAPNADYFAFCDQDDVWEPHKLITLVNLIQSIEKPAISFSGRSLIDANGFLIGSELVQEKHIGIRNALIQNIIPGNTLILNRSGREIAKENFSPDIQHYDAWLYLLMTCFGQVRFSSQLLTKYRIHGENQVGISRNLRSRFQNIEKSLRSFKLNALNVLKSAEHEISSENRSKVDLFLALLDCSHIRQRIVLLRLLKLSRKSMFETVLFNCYLAFRRS